MRLDARASTFRQQSAQTWRPCTPENWEILQAVIELENSRFTLSTAQQLVYDISHILVRIGMHCAERSPSLRPGRLSFTPHSEVVITGPVALWVCRPSPAVVDRTARAGYGLKLNFVSQGLHHRKVAISVEVRLLWLSFKNTHRCFNSLLLKPALVSESHDALAVSARRFFYKAMQQRCSQ